MDNPNPPDAARDVQFGLQRVPLNAKPGLVDQVFGRVARRYDIMNDFMSVGMHRIMKRMVLEMSGVRPGHRVLDLAGGTGDMSALFARAVGDLGQVILVDPNSEMIACGRDRLCNQGLANIRYCRASGEHLPFADASFDVACISFGLRNFTDKDQALLEIHRTLRPGGSLVVLEFSKPTQAALSQAYRAFQSTWPIAGKLLVGDAAPYHYLIESIEVHPNQAALKQMFEDAGFRNVTYHNLLGGIAAIHRGTRAGSPP